MIALENVCARAGQFELRDVSLAIERGTWAVVLGPAGAGKTTLLETIAGIRASQSGRVLLRGIDVTSAPAERRSVGMVYQHAYLFPHLSVRENVEYGLRNDGLDAVVELLDIAPLLERRVGMLSGGERQLVALARALASDTDILLLDEPFVALDPRRRTRVRSALRQRQRERGLTVLQVTHDFVEAGLLGDLAIVIEGGRVQQVAAPEQLFRAPATSSIAEFVGIENVFSGTVEHAGTEGTLCFRGEGIELYAVGERASGAGHAVIRAEDVTLAIASGQTSARNVLRGEVQEIAPSGVVAYVRVHVGSTSISALVTRTSVHELQLMPGMEVTVSIKAMNVHLC